jgi:hypothetical protein
VIETTRITIFWVIWDLEVPEIPIWIAIVDLLGSCCCSAIEIRFAEGCRLQEIHGFQKCSKLKEIHIPRSIQIISELGFRDCISITRLTFQDENNIREL